MSAFVNGQAVNWAAIRGRWKFAGKCADFEGEGESVSAGGSNFSLGLAVTDRSMDSGKCSVKVTFKGSFEDKSEQAAGVVFGYRSEKHSYVMLQLGAGGRAYSVSEYVPGFGWTPRTQSGSRVNLEPGKQYRLEGEVAGQVVQLKADNVPVVEYLLSRPLEGNQVGLIAAGNQIVKFEDFTADSDKRHVFVAMRFAEPYNTLYSEVIHKQVKELGFEPIRMDEKNGPGIVFQDMQREIQRAEVIIAEITPPNPNVFYELGYAQALNKPTILLARRDTQLPFDIQSYRVVFYDDTIGGKADIEQNLRKHLEAAVG